MEASACANCANAYLPRAARIVEVREEAEGIKTFTLEVEEAPSAFRFAPGQFLEVSVFGVGEAPFSISSGPGDGSGSGNGRLEITVAAVGEVTEELHGLGVGDQVGVRGPYGRGFPLEALRGRDILVVAGGIGLAPLRPAIEHVIAHRADFGHLEILYGARNPGLLCFRDHLKSWPDVPETAVRLIVDRAGEGWEGPVGTVTSLLDASSLRPESTSVLVCGPPVMIRHAIEDLVNLGFAPDDIITTLERRMECGVGKCGHCNVGRARVCVDGPVFSYAELLNLDERY